MNGQSRKRMASLAIGISTADPLPYMRGAINGATEFHHWATSAGYESEFLTDAPDKPVTIPILRQKLEEMLTRNSATMPGEPIYRFLLYFAGHGVIRDAGKSLWLLSDWSREGKAVDVEQLKKRIGRYGVSQISVFADACKKFPANIDTGELDEDSVLGWGGARSVYPPYIDSFDAVQDGYPALMVPGLSEEEDRCLFSGVLMEGLWGAPSALSSFVSGKVTSHSLSEFLRAEVPKRAASYNRKLFPNTMPMFPPDAAVYFCDVQPPPMPPPMRPWPDPAQIAGATQPAPAPAPRPPAAKPGFAGVVDDVLGAITSPFASFTTFTSPAVSVSDILEALRRKQSAPEPPEPPRAPEPDPGEVLQQRIAAQDVPTHFETGSGFAVEGGEIRAVWTLPGRFAGTAGRPDWWRITDSSSGWVQRPGAALIELASDQILALTVLPDFIASVVCNERGAQAVLYREVYTDKSMGGLAARAITEMESGSLRADSIADLTVELRQSKHADPTLGVISAYLYDSIGDLDSIRRMAWYYIQHAQGIPYDIALLAQAPARRNANGLLEIDIPAVPQRLPRTEKEKQFSWTCTATPSATGIVAGLWPWMRQGWGYLDDPTDVEAGLIDPAIAALRSQLTSARFTTFNAQGGGQLATYLGCIPNTP